MSDRPAPTSHITYDHRIRLYVITKFYCTQLECIVIRSINSLVKITRENSAKNPIIRSVHVRFVIV